MNTSCPVCKAPEMHPNGEWLLIRGFKTYDKLGNAWSQCLVCAGYYDKDYSLTENSFNKVHPLGIEPGEARRDHMKYGIELSYVGEANKPVNVFDYETGIRRPAEFETIEAAQECALALSQIITAGHYEGWTIVDLSIPA